MISWHVRDSLSRFVLFIGPSTVTGFLLVIYCVIIFPATQPLSTADVTHHSGEALASEARVPLPQQVVQLSPPPPPPPYPPAQPPHPRNRLPVARLNVHIDSDTDGLLTFTSAGSSDPDNDRLTYTWDFGDDTTVTDGATQTHQYAESGSYRVLLTVDDGNGGKDTAMTQVVVVRPKVVQHTATIDSEVLFDFDSATLKQEGREELLKVIIGFLQELNVNYEMHIVGHTDRVGTIKYNQGLSERRAKSVGHFFQCLGIKDHMIVEGKGAIESSIEEEKTHEERQPDRRAEIVMRTRNGTSNGHKDAYFLSEQMAPCDRSSYN